MLEEKLRLLCIQLVVDLSDLTKYFYIKRSAEGLSLFPASFYSAYSNIKYERQLSMQIVSKQIHADLAHQHGFLEKVSVLLILIPAFST